MSLGGDKVSKYYLQPLMMKSEIQIDTPGTPSDTHSIKDFFTNIEDV